MQLQADSSFLQAFQVLSYSSVQCAVAITTPAGEEASIKQDKTQLITVSALLGVTCFLSF